jgi:hypothetical protein
MWRGTVLEGMMMVMVMMVLVMMVVCGGGKQWAADQLNKLSSNSAPLFGRRTEGKCHACCLHETVKKPSASEKKFVF